MRKLFYLFIFLSYTGCVHVQLITKNDDLGTSWSTNSGRFVFKQGQEYLTASNSDSCRHCHRSHRGILKLANDPDHLSQQCVVEVVLQCEMLNIYRGKTLIATYHVPALTTPVLMSDASMLCFMVKTSRVDDSRTLCAHNMNCRNEWWKAITRAVLCSHYGTPQRKEIAGDPLIEEEEEIPPETVNHDHKRAGINIKLIDMPEIPAVELVKKKILAL